MACSGGRSSRRRRGANGHGGTLGRILLREGCCLALLLYMVAINVGTLPGHPLWAAPPAKTGFLKTALGFGQRWGMFEDVPSRNGWYVALARLMDGSEVDLLRGGAAVNWNRPNFPAGVYPNGRWRKCFREMAYTDEIGYQAFRAPVAEFLCRRWDQGRDPDKQVAEFELIYCNEPATPRTVRQLGLAASRDLLVKLDFAAGGGLPVVEGQ